MPEGENVGVGVVAEGVAKAGRPLPRETAIPVGVGVNDAAVEGPSPRWEPIDSSKGKNENDSIKITNITIYIPNHE